MRYLSKLIKRFSNYIPFQFIPNIVNEEDLDEKVNDKDFERPDTELEVYPSQEELKLPQENEDGVKLSYVT